MRNLFLFLWKNQFTVLFVLIETIGFYLLVSNNSYQQSVVHVSGVQLSGKVYDFEHSYKKYIGLLEENEALRNENALLRLASLNGALTQIEEIAQYDCIPTQAINSSYNLEKNFIIVNSGSASGLQPANAVIGTEGIVGIVHTVTENYASIIPMLHSDSKISGRLKGTNYFGQCKWEGRDDKVIMLENIPNHVPVAQGDTIITRGSTGIFPPGLIIGFASSSERDESSGFQRIQVNLATNFRKINTLYVIQNRHKEELDSLVLKTQEWIEK